MYISLSISIIISLTPTLNPSLCFYFCLSISHFLSLSFSHIKKWAAQCVLNGSQAHWTREVEETLKSGGNEGCYSYYEQLKRQLEDMVILIRGNISRNARTTVGALAVVDVHARDVQKKMAESGVSSVTDFDWISQMR
jgi:dynein heavy chain